MWHQIWHLTSFWQFDIFLTIWHLFNLNHLSSHRAIFVIWHLFRWFKFPLKPTNSITSGNLLSAIWDTSHWNFFVKFGLKTAWHISYDILWSILTYVNFWRLQDRLSTFAKIQGPQKIKVFSMKEQSVVDEAWGGFRWADNWATWWYHFFGGATHLRSAGGRWKKKRHFSGHLRRLKGYSELTHWTKNQSIGAA